MAVRLHFDKYPRRGAGGGRNTLIAIGRAAPAMLVEGMQHVAAPVVALAVTPYGNDRAIPGATVLTAGHLEPDEAGLRAGQRIIKVLKGQEHRTGSMR